MRLTALICTHNRLALLRNALASLRDAEVPEGLAVEVLVIANACQDGTESWLAAEVNAWRPAQLSLRWSSESTPGKSRALNHAIGLIDSDLVALVDDDQRVDRGFFRGIKAAADSYPDFSLFCGRILPDWDGTEPAWLHDGGPFRIYPPPIPSLDLGLSTKELTPEDRLPGGGSLFLRRDVFDRVGGFATDLGPHGHDLGGGEDHDFVVRALRAGERLRYIPQAKQYHLVEPERFRLPYLMKKGYLRSRAATELHSKPAARLPLFLWRKLFGYGWHALMSLYWPEKRFYLVRAAATVGEIHGYRRAGKADNRPRS